MLGNRSYDGRFLKSAQALNVGENLRGNARACALVRLSVFVLLRLADVMQQRRGVYDLFAKRHLALEHANVGDTRYIEKVPCLMKAELPVRLGKLEALHRPHVKRMPANVLDDSHNVLVAADAAQGLLLSALKRSGLRFRNKNSLAAFGMRAFACINIAGKPR